VGLGKILQPTLVLSGQNDRVTPPEAGRWMAEALPNARHVQVARAGHASLLSHVDEVAAAMQAFLGGIQGQLQGVAA
jgi:pimeloyl-ACP methyl ester carboxylesterase